MGCILAALAFFFPRVAIVILVIVSDYIGHAFNDRVLWPLLGFFFMPYTVLAYAFAKNAHGSVEGISLVLVVVAVLADLGVIGGGADATRRKRLGKVRASSSM